MAAQQLKDRCNGQTLGYVMCLEQPAPNQLFAYFPFVFEIVGKGSIMQPQLWKWKLKRNQNLLLHNGFNSSYPIQWFAKLPKVPLILL